MQNWADSRHGNDRKMLRKIWEKDKKKRERKIEKKGREKIESLKCLFKNQIVHVLNIKSDLCVIKFFKRRFLEWS